MFLGDGRDHMRRSALTSNESVSMDFITSSPPFLSTHFHIISCRFCALPSVWIRALVREQGTYHGLYTIYREFAEGGHMLV